MYWEILNMIFKLRQDIKKLLALTYSPEEKIWMHLWKEVFESDFE